MRVTLNMVWQDLWKEPPDLIGGLLKLAHFMQIPENNTPENFKEAECIVQFIGTAYFAKEYCE